MNSSYTYNGKQYTIVKKPNGFYVGQRVFKTLDAAIDAIHAI